MMNKILFTCIFLFLGSVSFAQLTWQNPRPSGFPNNYVHFTSVDTGFILNGAFNLIKTTNAGQSWNNVFTFPNAASMHVKGQEFLVPETYDNYWVSHNAGSTWQRKTTGNFQDGMSFCQLITRDTFFLASPNGKILRTNDGGNTWQSFTCSGGISSIFFVNSRVGYLTNLQDRILKSTDGGQTWNVCYSENTQLNLRRIYFIDENTGFVSRDFNTVFRTSDGGLTWSQANFSSVIYSFHFLNSQVGYMCGEFGKLYRTSNGGVTWQAAPVFTSFTMATSLFSVFFTSQNTGYAVGDRGIIWKTTNAGANWQQYGSIYETFNDVSFSTDSVAYGSTSTGLFKSTDAGITWQPLTNSLIFQPAPYELSHFFNKDTGIVTTGGSPYIRLFKTYDGGASWKIVHSVNVSNNHVSSFDFVDGQVGYLLAESSLSRTVDAGETWQVITSAAAIRKLDFIDAATGYGWNDKDLYKTTDSGKTWTKTRTEANTIATVHFPGLKDGFMGGSFGLFKKTTDSGKTWTTMTFPGELSYDDVLAIKFYDPKTGFMTAVNNRIYKTSDSGKTWIKYGSAYTCPVIKYTNNNGYINVYIAGQFGNVLKAPITNVSIENPFIGNLTDSSVDVWTRINAYYGGVDSIRFEYGVQQSQQFIGVPGDPSSATNQLITSRASITGLLPVTTYLVYAKLYLNGRYVTGPATLFTTPIKYVVAGGTPGSCESYSSVNINSSNNNQWVSIKDANGRAVADIKANGNNLGNVSASLFVNNGGVRDTAGFYFLDRNYSIQVQNQPTSPVSIKLYIKKSEYDKLVQIPAAGINNIGMLKIHKNSMSCTGEIGAAFTELVTTAEQWGDDYVLSAQINSFSSFYFSKPNVTLPVRMINFTANRNNKQIALSWQTLAESNSAYFEIERSEDGRNFEAIGKVSAAGQSNASINYIFNDVLPLSGINYYRLNIVDKDQRSNHSRIVSADMRPAKSVILSVNPVKESLLINGSEKFKNFHVVDTHGKLLKQFTYSSSNTYSVKELLPGMYYLRCMNDAGVTVVKFIKQ